MKLPHGVESVLFGASMVMLSMLSPRGRRRYRKGKHLAIIGLLIEFGMFFGGITLVLFGVARSF